MNQYIHGTTDKKPAECGYNADRLSLLADCYRNLVEKGTVQAAGFLLARDGNVFAHQAIGRLTYRDDSPPFTPDSIKNIASITKIITATAIMKLVEDGRIWLEQRVCEIIEEFNTPMHQTINIRHLLTHTSGLRADPGYHLEPYPETLFDWLSEEGWLKKVLSGPVQSKPGEIWAYCSLGYCILAEIVSRVSGKHFIDYVQDEIFTPLGMDSSSIELPKQHLDRTVIMGEEHKRWIEEDRIRQPYACPPGGGGANATMHDMFKLAQCYLNGGTYNGVRILGKTTCQAMTRNQLDGVPSNHWGTWIKNYRQGLGWGFFADGPTVSPETYNHEGWGWCSLFIEPVERFIYISMAATHTEWNPDVMVKPRTIAWSGIE